MPDVKQVDAQKLSKTLGRHTRIGVRFSWSKAGALVDLNGYTVRIWVTTPDGETAGPFTATVNENEATYFLSADDLEQASLSSSENVKIMAVAENGNQVLVSDAREIPVGNWGGADEFEPVS